MQVSRVGSIWERASAVAFVGIGVGGFLFPAGLQMSTFFPLLQPTVTPVMMAVFVLFIGAMRYAIFELSPHLVRFRIAVAFLSLAVWAEWSASFLVFINVQGVRPGMIHLLAMCYGELLLIYDLSRHLRAAPEGEA